VLEEAAEWWIIVFEKWSDFSDLLCGIKEVLQLVGGMKVFEWISYLVDPMEKLDLLFSVPAIVPMVKFHLSFVGV